MNRIQVCLESELLATLGKWSRYKILFAEGLGDVTVVVVSRDSCSAVEWIFVDTNNLALLILGHSILAELYKVLGMIRSRLFLNVISTLVFGEDLLPQELLHAIGSCGYGSRQDELQMEGTSYSIGLRLLNRLLRYGRPKLICVSVFSVVHGPEFTTLNFSLRLIVF